MQQFPSLVMKQGEKKAEDALEGRIADLSLTERLLLLGSEHSAPGLKNKAWDVFLPED